MGARGPGKTPDNIKRISGTFRQDRSPIEAVELPMVDGLPDAPDWLPNAHAVKEWDRLAPILYGVGVLTEASLSTLGYLCSLHGTIVQIYAAGLEPNGTLQSQLTILIKEFGLTPKTQSQIKANAEKTKGNKFDKFK